MGSTNAKPALCLQLSDLLEFLGWVDSPPILPAQRGDYVRILEVDYDTGIVLFETENNEVDAPFFGGALPRSFFRQGEWRIVRGGLASYKKRPIEE